MPRSLTEPEFEAAKSQAMQRLLRDYPDTLDQASFERLAGPYLQQAIGEVENRAPVPDGSPARRLLGGLAETVNPVSMVTGTYQAVRHPLDTARALYQTERGLASKAKERFQQGRYAEAAGYAGGMLIPPAVAAGEQIAGGDIAGGVGKGLGLVALASAPSIGREAKAAVRKRATAREAAAAAAAPEKFATTIKEAIPQRVKGYTSEDLRRATPYLQQEASVRGGISSVPDFYDATKSAITNIESGIGAEVSKFGSFPLRAKNPIDYVSERLASNPAAAAQSDFVQRGLASLREYALEHGFDLSRAEKTRVTLNAKLDDALGGTTARRAVLEKSRPDFAAQSYLLDYLRDGIYDSLEGLGATGAREARRDVGALIAMRNAAEKVSDFGEDIVSASAKDPTLLQRAGKMVTHHAPIPRSITQYLDPLFEPTNRTRNQLLADAFAGPHQTPVPSHFKTPPAPAGLLGLAPTPLGPSPDPSFVRSVPAVATPGTTAARTGRLLGPAPTPLPVGPVVSHGVERQINVPGGGTMTPGATTPSIREIMIRYQLPQNEQGLQEALVILGQIANKQP